MDLFSSTTTAEGYARARPKVHPWVVARLHERLQLSGRLGCALDVGCGAGLSTAPLRALARVCLGIEPVAAMLRFAGAVAPGAAFAVARAEDLPVRSGSVDLLTAAGSLNYVDDLGRFFAEARRALAPGGTLAVYDFGQGGSCRETPALAAWFLGFSRRYPLPAGSARPLDPAILASFEPTSGLRLDDALQFERGVDLTLEGYLDYLMSEANVPAAVASGAREEEIRAWCAHTLQPVFEGAAREVVFEGYLACLVRAADARPRGRGAAA